MHPNPIYRSTPEMKALAFAAERGFGTLMVNGPDGPLAAHVPFVLSEDSKTAEMHLVRSNPVARALAAPAPALLSIMGPDSYVSSDWYGLADQVPTWNYLGVHLRGRLELLPQEALRPHLDRLSAEFERRLLPKKPWTADKMPDEVLDRLMRMIVPCRLVITDVQSTWKLGQNKPADARNRAADQMATVGIGQETAALAKLMRAVQS
ncbi:FMN-binding negative transcriptional regulator [Frigidibacter sp. RF13]|uniref:FMN-binding negative transcriptional regulator n=1 Tax=Frigidibacter sp. RF13 TaxID=2997340 RepID=UPI00226FFE8E|nr:FMN-binding negative transcriptional regulator [Frigidibacter sp. RF13]MCY1128753.1 FMN-binding negative transcriptional regulator [Frigidibacter sp. RF13]